MRDLPASVSFAAVAPGALGCQLCSTPEAVITSITVVQHSRGGRVEFATCNRCMSAIKRLAAAAGESAHFVLAQAAAPIAANSEQIGQQGAVTVAVETFREFPTLLRDGNGTDYHACVCGGERPDG